MRFWVGVLLVLALALLLNDVIVITLMVTVGGSGADSHFSYRTALDGMQNNVREAIDKVLQPMLLAAELVQQTDPLIESCQLLQTNDTANGVLFDPEHLIAIQNTFSNNPLAPETLLQSVGFISASKSVGSGSFDFKNKESWELALHFGCSDYIFGYTDASLNYYGYCAYPNFTVDYSTVVYNGSDYGLTPDEQALMQGQESAVFLPPFKLNANGQNTMALTYERAFRCVPGGAVYGLVFAEKNFAQLDADMQQLNTYGRAFVLESQTGLLLTASLPGQTIDSVSQIRNVATNVTDRLIREASIYVLSIEGSFANIIAPTEYSYNGMLIDVRPYSYPACNATLAWLQLTVVLESDFWSTSNVQQHLVLVGVITALVMVLVILGSVEVPLFAFANWISSKQLSDIKQRLVSQDA